MALVNLVYTSSLCPNLPSGSSDEQLHRIVLQAHAKNRARGVTGVIACDDTQILQLLEGEADVVWDLFKVIRHDRRHTDVSFIEMAGVTEPYFGDHPMSFVVRNAKNNRVFVPYLRDGRFKPSAMNAVGIMSLLMDLRRFLTRPEDRPFERRARIPAAAL